MIAGQIAENDGVAGIDFELLLGQCNCFAIGVRSGGGITSVVLGISHVAPRLVVTVVELQSFPVIAKGIREPVQSEKRSGNVRIGDVTGSDSDGLGEGAHSIFVL